MAPKYRLLALDVDGTLVGRDNIVPPDVAAAVGAAEAAGIRIVLATGRSYVETVGVWRQLGLKEPFEPMVLIGGALVSEAHSGRTLWQQPIPRAVAVEFSNALGDAGYSAMAILDVWRHGVEYIVAEHGRGDEAHRLWFSKMNVKVHRVERIAEAPEMPDPLRISAVVESTDAAAVSERLREQFHGRLTVHAILAPNYGVTIVESFAPGVSKFTAVQYVAQAYRIGPGQIAAVGDDVNDLELIRKVGLGVAMPNGSPMLIAEADQVAENGLAAFIRELVE
ncbi:MAG: Cof-type HAD-IIB family hydrolase [Planctomycetaceae bacterium]|nr:Cof-type HAD-IIB family hydrolase [Planctomycetaceae bacterium]